MELKLKQSQRLLMNLAMRQAFHVLQMPLADLCSWVEEQIEENPLLERIDPHKVELPPQEELEQKPTLFAHLMNQVAYSCFSEKERLIAEKLIGNLDDRGFYTLPLKPSERPVLKKIQQFDPPGIGATSLQESLLLQLEAKNLTHSAQYHQIEHHFDPIDTGQLLGLSTSPACAFDHRPIQTLLPDVIIENQSATVSEEGIPEFCLSPYIDLYLEEDPVYVRRQISAGKWLARILTRRSQTLQKITTHLLEAAPKYFEGKTHLPPTFTLKELALELELNPSTIARALKDKHLSCVHGILPFSTFLRRNLSAKELIKTLIAKEPKKKPLSDQALADALAIEGIPTARRTVTKYRQSLSIPPANQRKSH